MLRRFGQATEPIADEYFRIRRRLNGEIGTLTRQFESDPVLSVDATARSILERAQTAVRSALVAMDDASDVPRLYAIEEDAIRSVRVAQRRLRERKASLLAAEPVEPEPTPEPVVEPEPEDGGSGPVVTEDPSEGGSFPPVVQAKAFPWGWFVGGLGVGMAGLSVIRRRR